MPRRIKRVQIDETLAGTAEEPVLELAPSDTSYISILLAKLQYSLERGATRRAVEAEAKANRRAATKAEMQRRVRARKRARK
jgi:hypothetical protein